MRLRGTRTALKVFKLALSVQFHLAKPFAIWGAVSQCQQVRPEGGGSARTSVRGAQFGDDGEARTEGHRLPVCIAPDKEREPRVKIWV